MLVLAGGRLLGYSLRDTLVASNANVGGEPSEASMPPVMRTTDAMLIEVGSRLLRRCQILQGYIHFPKGPTAAALFSLC